MLQTFLDESQRESGTFCVAGYTFAPPQARKFVKEWSRLFSSTTFHMVDLVAGRKQFKDMQRQERDRLLKEAIVIIKRRISIGVAMSCNVHEMRQLSPRWIRGFGDAYPVCCYMSMAALGDKIRKSNSHERVTYIFEAGHTFEAEANDFVRNAIRSPELRERFRYHGHAFLPKSDAVPLQAADLFAWEWAKFRDETVEREIRPARLSLRALLGDDPKKQYCGYHVTGTPLTRYMQKIHDLGLLQLREEREM